VGPMSGFSNELVDKEFFNDTSIKSNFLCNLGYPDKDGYYERAPRYSFSDIAEIL
jgi:3-hydroxypropanoate dehydrogenase